VFSLLSHRHAVRSFTPNTTAVARTSTVGSTPSARRRNNRATSTARSAGSICFTTASVPLTELQRQPPFLPA
jgi:hypothetical protein